MMKPVAFLLLFVVAALGGAQTLDDLTVLKNARSFRVSSSAEDWKNSNVDYRPIRPGETLTLADLKGPGTIERLWMTVLPSEPGFSRLLTLRIYWDGEAAPSVECPIGDFFGAGHGINATVESIPVRASAEGRARSCIWRMPFRRSARITVTNDGREATWGFYYMVDGEYGPVAKDAPYFHASYRQSFPVGAGNYVVADIKGRGHYVGTVLSIRATTGGWWGEGDDFFTIDGEEEPSLRGTGLEDYFGEAWGIRKVLGPYSGCSISEGFVGGRITAYRWHVPDPIRFTKSLRVEIEHKGVVIGQEGNNHERPDDEYSSAAFWYQTGPHAPYPPLPPGPDRLPLDYRRFVEAESLSVPKPTSGATAIVKVPGLHGGAQLEWSSPEEGAELTLPFRVDAGGMQQILVLVTKRWDGGQGRFLLDGVPLGDEVSFLSGDYATHQEIALPFTNLTPGEHKLTLRSVGGPARPWFGIDGLLVQPMRPSKG